MTQKTQCINGDLAHPISLEKCTCRCIEHMHKTLRTYALQSLAPATSRVPISHIVENSVSDRTQAAFEHPEEGDSWGTMKGDIDQIED